MHRALAHHGGGQLETPEIRSMRRYKFVPTKMYEQITSKGKRFRKLKDLTQRPAATMAKSCAVSLHLLLVGVFVCSCTGFLSSNLPLRSSSQTPVVSFSRPSPLAIAMTLDRRGAVKLLGGTAGALLGAPAVVSAVDASEGGAWAVHETPFKDSEFADFKTTESGLKYKDVLEGSGEQPKQGETVRAHYAGYLLDGTLFDTSYRPALFPFSLITPSGPPQAFKLITGTLIPGFEQALPGMKVGGKRIIYVEPKLGYGAQGAGSTIPPNSPLVFYLELRSIGSKLSL